MACIFLYFTSILEWFLKVSSIFGTIFFLSLKLRTQLPIRDSHSAMHSAPICTGVPPPKAATTRSYRLVHSAAKQNQTGNGGRPGWRPHTRECKYEVLCHEVWCINVLCETVSYFSYFTAKCYFSTDCFEKHSALCPAVEMLAALLVESHQEKVFQSKSISWNSHKRRQMWNWNKF